MKDLYFAGSSRRDLADFPAEARRDAGFQLRRVQAGEDPIDWKPMPTVGPGVREIRVHASGEWRVIYVAKLKDAVYVLSAFRKKTQKTPDAEIEIARKRYKEITK